MAQALWGVRPDVNTDFEINRDGTRLLILNPHDPEGTVDDRPWSLSVNLNWFTEIEAQR